eukprot:SAG31_NODE_11_length_38734_cov_21.263854_22_plen_232_part_00
MSLCCCSESGAAAPPQQMQQADERLVPAKSNLAARLGAGPLVLDGGFSTHCEHLGADLSIGRLWSARLIYESPDTVKQAHRDFLAAGADIIGTASYQGTVRGFMDAGKSKQEAQQLLARSVELAREARDAFWTEAQRAQQAQEPAGEHVKEHVKEPEGEHVKEHGKEPAGEHVKEHATSGTPAGRLERGPPLVAACIGPYGGYLNDGSEYSGSYGAISRIPKPRHQLPHDF